MRTFNETLELSFLTFRDYGLFVSYLVHKFIHVRSESNKPYYEDKLSRSIDLVST